MKYLLLVIVVGLFFSCSDFLEPKSQSEYIPQDAVSLNEMLLGEAYPQAGDPAAMLDILSMLDDDICCTDTTGGNVGLNDDRNYIALKAVFSWQPDFWKTMQENSNYYKNYWDIGLALLNNSPFKESYSYFKKASDYCFPTIKDILRIFLYLYRNK